MYGDRHKKSNRNMKYEYYERAKPEMKNTILCKHSTSFISVVSSTVFFLRGLSNQKYEKHSFSNVEQTHFHLFLRKHKIFTLVICYMRISNLNKQKNNRNSRFRTRISYWFMACECNNDRYLFSSFKRLQCASCSRILSLQKKKKQKSHWIWRLKNTDRGFFGAGNITKS